jgi:hypothetical protein
MRSSPYITKEQFLERVRYVFIHAVKTIVGLQDVQEGLRFYCVTTAPVAAAMMFCGNQRLMESFLLHVNRTRRICAKFLTFLIRKT